MTLTYLILTKDTAFSINKMFLKFVMFFKIMISFPAFVISFIFSNYSFIISILFIGIYLISDIILFLILKIFGIISIGVR